MPQGCALRRHIIDMSSKCHPRLYSQIEGGLTLSVAHLIVE